MAAPDCSKTGTVCFPDCSVVNCVHSLCDNENQQNVRGLVLAVANAVIITDGLQWSGRYIFDDDFQNWQSHKPTNSLPHLIVFRSVYVGFCVYVIQQKDPFLYPFNVHLKWSVIVNCQAFVDRSAVSQWQKRLCIFSNIKIIIILNKVS